MPLDLNVVFALKTEGKLLKCDLVVLGDNGANLREEVLPFVFENGGHGMMR